MKKLSVVLYLLICNTASTFAAVAVPETMKQAMKGDSDMPSLLNLVLSLAIVIGLIYLTGWVYQKLNKINRKSLVNRELIDKNSFNILSSMPLGQQKNLYAVEINDKVLVIGATAQNITLLKEFDKNENVDKIQAEDVTDKKNEKTEELDELFKKYKNV